MESDSSDALFTLQLPPQHKRLSVDQATRLTAHALRPEGSSVENALNPRPVAPWSAEQRASLNAFLSEVWDSLDDLAPPAPPSLSNVTDDPALDRALVIRGAHEKELMTWWKAGHVVLRDPVTMLAVPPSFAATDMGRAVLTRTDFVRFAASLHIAVVEGAVLLHNPSSERWTPDALAELQAYKDAHGTKKAAEKFAISGSRVRNLCPSSPPAPQVNNVFTHRVK